MGFAENFITNYSKIGLLYEIRMLSMSETLDFYKTIEEGKAQKRNPLYAVKYDEISHLINLRKRYPTTVFWNITILNTSREHFAQARKKMILHVPLIHFS